MAIRQRLRNYMIFISIECIDTYMYDYGDKMRRRT